MWFIYEFESRIEREKTYQINEIYQILKDYISDKVRKGYLFNSKELNVLISFIRENVKKCKVCNSKYYFCISDKVITCYECKEKVIRCYECDKEYLKEEIEDNYIYLIEEDYISKVYICDGCKENIPVDVQVGNIYIKELKDYSHIREDIRGTSYGFELEIYDLSEVDDILEDKLISLLEKGLLIFEYDGSVAVECKINKPMKRYEIYQIYEDLDLSDCNVMEHQKESSGGHVHISISDERKAWKSNIRFKEFLYQIFGNLDYSLIKKYFGRKDNEFCHIDDYYVDSRYFFVNFTSKTLEVRLFSTFARLEYKLNISLLFKLLYYGHFYLFGKLVKKLGYEDLFNLRVISDILEVCLDCGDIKEEYRKNVKSLSKFVFEEYVIA